MPFRPGRKFAGWRPIPNVKSNEKKFGLKNITISGPPTEASWEVLYCFARIKRMLINIEPLRKNRDYRLLFIGQLISFLGSMVSYVAIPYQVYELTKDNWLVGALGAVQLGPVLVFGILGGTYADRLNRRKLLLVSEFLMAALISGLALNSLRETPSLLLIFILVAFFQAVLGFHRPAMEALTQKIIEKKDY